MELPTHRKQTHTLRRMFCDAQRVHHLHMSTMLAPVNQVLGEVVRVVV